MSGTQFKMDDRRTKPISVGLCLVNEKTGKFTRMSVSRGSLKQAVGAVVCCAAVLLSSCSADGSSPAADGAAATSEAPKPVAPKTNVKDGATDVSPTETIEVTSEGEGLKKVTMTNEEGTEVDSELSKDSMTWTNTEPLGFNRTYKIVAEDKNGKSSTTTFNTVAPGYLSESYLTPMEGSTVGVGQVIGLRFDSAITDRKAVEKAVKVTTSPEVEGAFYWISNQEVRWRPAEFWEPGTEVTVEADLYGMKLGEGMYAANSSKTNFTIGDKVEAVVDDSTKTMTVYKNGEKLRSMPVSLGSSAWPTPNGIYVIGDEHASLVMDSTSYGLALENGGYRTPVEYATQMSYSGIFVHAAPWSVWAQGSSNVSHGCVNVTTENAAWFQETVKRGDIVTVKNTIGETLSPYDGLGDWNLDWDTWKKGNADDV